MNLAAGGMGWLALSGADLLALTVWPVPLVPDTCPSSVWGVG